MSQTLLIAGIALGLLVLALAFVLLRDRDATQRRVFALFRRAPRPPKTPGAGHYYKTYWS